MEQVKGGHLYVIATPIGNLEDLTHRAVSLLPRLDLLLVEDTRRARVLLNHYHIAVPTLWSCFEGNEHRRIPGVLRALQEGKAVGLLSDAGTPTISDPGYRMVHAVREAGFPVVPVPGPSAVIAALSVSGLPTDRFVFEGFLPRTAGKRRRRLEALQDDPRTLVFYESVHRIERTLQELRDHLGAHRRVFVGRELTKQHEEGFYGTLEEAVRWCAHKKGEFVIVVEGRS